MATNPKFQEKRKNSRTGNPNQQAITNARAVATAFVCDLYLYFDALPGVVNCETNADGAPIPIFDIKQQAFWFGYTLCFEYEGYSFRLYFGFECDPEKPKVQDRSKTNWPIDLEPRNLYKHVSNYWLQLNLSKTFEPHDGFSKFLIRFDASPHWANVDVFPHHKHLYENNKDTQGLPFNGTLDSFIDELQDMVQNQPLFGAPK